MGITSLWEDLEAKLLTPGQLLGYPWKVWGITVQTSYVEGRWHQNWVCSRPTVFLPKGHENSWKTEIFYHKSIIWYRSLGHLRSSNKTQENFRGNPFPPFMTHVFWAVPCPRPEQPVGPVLRVWVFHTQYKTYYVLHGLDSVLVYQV